MKNYSLTITNNSSTFSNDLTDLKQPIEDLIDKIHSMGIETGIIGWEFQPTKPYCLHIHTHFASNKMPYFKNINKSNQLNIKCETLPDIEDVEQWVSYCHKEQNVPLNERWFFKVPIYDL